MIYSESQENKENVILVTEKDAPLGVCEKIKAHKEGLCHRAFSVFVTRKLKDSWQVLLQKRAKHKYHSGGLWSNTCCGHPRPGEDIEQAASRRLKEEMGLELKLLPIGVFHYTAKLDNSLTENEVDHVFVDMYNNENFAVNPDEVAEVKFIAFDELARELQNNPKQYTFWLASAFRLVQNWRNSICLN